jgi:hypothetical protein
MDQQFRLTLSEVRLLDVIVSSSLVSVRCLGCSLQNAVIEPGVFCQAVVLQTTSQKLMIKPVTEDFGDVEVFWLSVVDAGETSVINDYEQMRTVELSGSAIGTISQWQKIEFTIEFARKEECPIRAHLDFGLLFHGEDGKRILLMTSPLPFFMRCITESIDIDAALASLA